MSLLDIWDGLFITTVQQKVVKSNDIVQHVNRMTIMIMITFPALL